MNESITHPRNDAAPFSERCPQCESPHIRIEERPDTFLYGEAPATVKLTAPVPLHICQDCELEYTDEVGSLRRHEAVCRHLGFLTPSEITSIYQRHGLSRRRFAELSKIGLASLARWESGQSLQNPAMDAYLKLLARPDVFALHTQGAEGRTGEVHADANKLRPRDERFRSLTQKGRAEVDRVTREQDAFSLCSPAKAA